MLKRNVKQGDEILCRCPRCIPDRFDEKQWASISSDFDGDLSGGKRLRAMKLANGDEPDATFRP